MGSGPVASVRIRIEAGPGGPETDQWVLDVQLGPGVRLVDVDALAVALVGTLTDHVGEVAQALRRLAAA